MINQRTIKSVVRTSGVGLHSGERVTLILSPSLANTGINFRRTDFAQPIEFQVNPNLVTDTKLCSVIEYEGVRVSTVEHIMSALAGLCIDNINLELDAAEVPIMDGSAAPFIYLIQSVGIEEQKIPRKFIKVLKTVRVEDGDKWAELKPFDGFRMNFKIDFDHPVLKKSAREICLNFAGDTYIKEISRARTFGFMRDVEYLRSNNLALGGSLDNAIVMDDYRILNNSGLRYTDEFVKHKVLDAVGDLYLAGHPILGEFTAYKSGHGLNNQLLCALLEDKGAWVWYLQ